MMVETAQISDHDADHRCPELMVLTKAAAGSKTWVKTAVPFMLLFLAFRGQKQKRAGHLSASPSF
jgi:hypothetical protein